MNERVVVAPGAIPADSEADGAPAIVVRGYWQSVLRRLRYDWVTIAFGLVVLAIIIVAIAAPLIAPFDPYQQSIVGRLKPFGWRGHPWGTDELGRDMMSRLIYGGRISLVMGLAPVLNRHAGRRHAGCDRRLRWPPGQYRHHAHHGRVLRLSVHPAGGRDLRRDGWRHDQRHHLLEPGVHPRDVPRRGNRDGAGEEPGLHRRPRAPAAPAR